MEPISSRRASAIHWTLFRAAMVFGLFGVGLHSAQPPGGVDAEAPVPSTLSLAQAFELALSRNSEIGAAVLFARAQREGILSARGAFDSRLFADTGWEDADLPSAGSDAGAARYSSGRFSVGVRKRFVSGTEAELASAVDYTDVDSGSAGYNPVFDSALSLVLRQDLLRNAGIDVNRTEILTAEDRWSIARQTVRDVTMETLYGVESAYWSLYFATADLRVRRAQLERAMRLVSVAESQVRVGEAAPIEITRSRSSAASQEVAIVDAENRISLLRNRLMRLLGVRDPGRLPGDTVLVDEPGDTRPVEPLRESVQIAWERRPDCRSADLLLRIAELQERYARNQKRPSLQLYGGIGLAGQREAFAGSASDMAGADYPTWQVGVALEVPLPNRTATGNYRAAVLERQRRAVLRRAILEQALREVADALDELASAARQIDTAREARRLAQELLTAEEKSFRLGRSDSLDVLDAQAALAAAERNEIRARTAYAASLAFLYRVRGDLLEQKGLEGAE